MIISNLRRAQAGPEPVPSPALKNEQVQYCLLFGVGDQEPTRWDGSIQAWGARVVKLDGWHLDEDDAIEGNQWKLSTRRVIVRRRRRGLGVNAAPVLENGVYVTVELLDADARFEVESQQGSFSLAAAEARFGETPSFLNGRVKVERVPLSRQLTTSIDEQDQPALALSGDTVYLA